MWYSLLTTFVLVLAFDLGEKSREKGAPQVTSCGKFDDGGCLLHRAPFARGSLPSRSCLLADRLRLTLMVHSILLWPELLSSMYEGPQPAPSHTTMDPSSVTCMGCIHF